MPCLECLQGLVERPAKHVKAAAARVGEALRIILEADGLDEARYEKVRAPDEIPQAPNRDDADQGGHDQAGAYSRRRRSLGNQQDRADEQERAPGEPELEL